MAKMTLKRLDSGGFELSGGPLVFKAEKDLIDTCVKLMSYPNVLYCAGDGWRLLDSPLTIDDEVKAAPNS